MSSLPKALVLLIIFSATLAAEDLVRLGIQGAMNSLRTVPAATAKEAEDAATKILQPYLKPTQGGFFIRTKGSTGKWIEVRSLHVRNVTLGTISQADRANGLSERILVSFSADMHRSQKSEQVWSDWRNGLPGFLPSAMRVEKKNGHWNGGSTILGILQPCNDQAISIPTKRITRPAATAPLLSRNSRIHAPGRTAVKPPHKAQPTTTDKDLAKAMSDVLVRGITKLAVALFLLLGFIIAIKSIFRRPRGRRSQAPPIPGIPNSPPPLPRQP